MLAGPDPTGRLREATEDRLEFWGEPSAARLSRRRGRRGRPERLLPRDRPARRRRLGNAWRPSHAPLVAQKEGEKRHEPLGLLRLPLALLLRQEDLHHTA